MLRFIEGPAGSGKTHRLSELTATQSGEVCLKPHQAVLALTFMHGSRRRMESRLNDTLKRRSLYLCSTFDSFAAHLLERWSTLVKEICPNRPVQELGFDEKCQLCADLLQSPYVSSWVSVRFPLVVVDEVQDLDEGRTRMLSALSTRSDVLAAGDEFQDLRGTGSNVAIEWLRNNAICEPLGAIHRTKVCELLNAANDIRAGREPAEAKGFKIHSVPKFELAAWHISSIAARCKAGTLAVITPTVKGFAESAVRHAAAKALGQKYKVGPYTIQWESREDGVAETLWTALNIPADVTCNLILERLRDTDDVHLKQLRMWVSRIITYSGERTLHHSEIQSKLREIVHQQRAYSRRTGEARRTVLTVHQAKNREFDSVVVLWPKLGTKWTCVQQRRLLYNAITRAKKEVNIIVHAPRGERPIHDLFQNA